MKGCICALEYFVHLLPAKRGIRESVVCCVIFWLFTDWESSYPAL